MGVDKTSPLRTRVATVRPHAAASDAPSTAMLCTSGRPSCDLSASTPSTCSVPEATPSVQRQARTHPSEPQLSSAPYTTSNATISTPRCSRGVSQHATPQDSNMRRPLPAAETATDPADPATMHVQGAPSVLTSVAVSRPAGGVGLMSSDCGGRGTDGCVSNRNISWQASPS
eukprot:1543514-Prymnesium_polylepis.2